MMKKNHLKNAGKTALSAALAVTMATSMFSISAVAAEDVGSVAVLADSSLDQSSNYPPTYTEGLYTVDQLKTMLAEKIEKYKNLWEEKGGLTYWKNNRSVQTSQDYYEKAILYLEEGNSTAMTFSWRCYQMDTALKTLNSDANIHTEATKAIYALNEEMASLNSINYTTDSWNAYADMVNEAMTKANGSGTSEERLQQYVEEIKELKEALVEIDQQLIQLKALVEECEAITYDNYTRESWQALGAAIMYANEELDKSEVTIDDAVFEELYGNLQGAKEGLTPAATSGAEYGILDYWQGKTYETNQKVRGGKLYVSGEKILGNGYTELTITWINDGTNPETGGLFHNRYTANEEYSLRPFTESDWEEDDEWWIDLSGSLFNDQTVEDPMLTEEDYDGCTKTVIVPTGTTVELELHSWGNTGSDAHSTARTYSMGTYYTKSMDYSELDAAIEQANELLTDSDTYTPASMEALKSMLDQAVNVRSTAQDQSELDQALAQLNDAIAGITERADKQELQEAVDAAEKIDQSGYTEESVEDLKNALTEANHVLDDPNASEEDVKAALDQLTKAVNALSVLPDRPADEEKPADQGDKENTEDQVDTSAAAMAGSYAFALVAGGIALGGIRKRQRSEKK